MSIYHGAYQGSGRAYLQPTGHIRARLLMQAILFSLSLERPTPAAGVIFMHCNIYVILDTEYLTIS